MLTKCILLYINKINAIQTTFSFKRKLEIIRCNALVYNGLSAKKATAKGLFSRNYAEKPQKPHKKSTIEMISTVLELVFQYLKLLPPKNSRKIDVGGISLSGIGFT